MMSRLEFYCLIRSISFPIVDIGQFSLFKFLQVVKEILMKFGDAKEGAVDHKMALWPWALQDGFEDYFKVPLNIIAEYIPLNRI